MSAPQSGRERVLLALAVLEGESISDELAGLLGTTEVILVGYHEVPEQTAPSQMRQQYESQAERILDEVAGDIRDAGGTVDQRLVFTHDLDQSLDRIEDEVEATAELLANPTGAITDMLVPVRGDVDPARLARFAAALRGDRELAVTILVPTTESDKEEDTELAQEIASRLRDHGISEDAIGTEIRMTDAPAETVVETAIDHDVIVMGKQDPNWRAVLFGDPENRVARESLGPVFVVRQQPAE